MIEKFKDIIFKNIVKEEPFSNEKLIVLGIF